MGDPDDSGDLARKEAERDLHDHLRGDQAGDPLYTSNKRFYSINGSQVGFVKEWLAARCSGKRALDFCCGNGELAIWLRSNGAEVHGIDISPVSIDNARIAAGEIGMADIRFEVMDGEAMKFPSDYFDHVVVSGVLHHLDLDRAYAELSRVLKPEGSVIATEALKHNPLIHYYRKRTPHLRSKWEVEHILGKGEIEAAKEYFDDVRVVRFFCLAAIAAIPLRRTPIFAPVLRLLEAVDSVLFRLPWVKWQAWMAVFTLARPKGSSNSSLAK